VARTGTQRARDERCDFVIGFGGGSVIDTGKAIAALLTNGGDPLDYAEVIGKGQPFTKSSAPYMAIPTTAGTGAEVTRNAVLGSPEQRVKVSLRSAFMLPARGIDRSRTHVRFTAAVDGDYRHGCADAIDRGICLGEGESDDRCDFSGGHDASGRGPLRRAYEHSEDVAARQDMCIASVFGGMALRTRARCGARAGRAARGMFDAPHGALCAALLPHAMEVNRGMIRGPAGRGAVSAPTEIVRRFEEVARSLAISVSWSGR